MEIARDLGIPLVTIASDWPPEWVSSYSTDYAHAPAAAFDVPSRTAYDRVWSSYVAAISECLEIADKHQLETILVNIKKISGVFGVERVYQPGH